MCLSMCVFCVPGHHAAWLSYGFVHYLGSHWLGAPGLASSCPHPLAPPLAAAVSCERFQLSVKDTGLSSGMFFLSFHLDNSLCPWHLNSRTASSGTALQLSVHIAPRTSFGSCAYVNVSLPFWSRCFMGWGRGHPGEHSLSGVSHKGRNRFVLAYHRSLCLAPCLGHTGHSTGTCRIDSL